MPISKNPTKFDSTQLNKCSNPGNRLAKSLNPSATFFFQILCKCEIFDFEIPCMICNDIEELRRKQVDLDLSENNRQIHTVRIFPYF